MSTTTLITIWCDYERDPPAAGACSEWFADTAPWTAKEARALAKRVGWRYVPWDTTGPARDFCPKHAT